MTLYTIQDPPTNLGEQLPFDFVGDGGSSLRRDLGNDVLEAHPLESPLAHDLLRLQLDLQTQILAISAYVAFFRVDKGDNLNLPLRTE